jgi:hypothetical protein
MKMTVSFLMTAILKVMIGAKLMSNHMPPQLLLYDAIYGRKKNTITFLSTATLKLMFGGKLMPNYTQPQLSLYDAIYGGDKNNNHVFDSDNFKIYGARETDA